MKKIILSAIAILGFTTFMQAQISVRPGIKGGLNLSNMVLEGPTDVTRRGFGPGFYAGLLAEFSSPAGSKFKGQAEALFNFHNVKLNTPSTTLRLSQVSVPLMVRYFFTPAFSVNAGGSLNFNVGAKEFDDRFVYNYNTNNQLNSFQPGLLVGATYYIKDGFFIDGRYNYYLGDFITDYKAALSAFQIGLGYKFD